MDDITNNIEKVLRYLLPEGVFRGSKFYVGDVQGNAGDSLIIELSGKNKGLWYDFATSQGGNILQLWSKVRNVSVAEATKEAKSYLNLKSQTMTAGKAWQYTDANGKLVCTITRYDNQNGKYYVPRLKDGRKGMPEYRPLYNLSQVINADKVIIAEGEKAADAIISAGLVATTAMGGANAPLAKTNWEVLRGKEVIIWGDNDEAGRNYARRLVEHLTPIAGSVRLLAIPPDKPNKWDAADALSAGMDINAFINNNLPEAVTATKVLIEKIYSYNLVGTPPPRDWVIENWLPRGYVSALYGDGGVGKSLLAQQIMTCVAMGKDFAGLKINKGRALGVFCEDEKNELWRRQFAISNNFNLPIEHCGQICLIPRLGEDNLLMTFDGKDQGKLTDFADNLLQEVVEFAPDLVVLDTAADLFAGNENNRTHVRQFIQNACGVIARRANCAVLLCAHPSVAGLQNKTGTGGSTAWHNTVRSRWYLEYVKNDNEQNLYRTLSMKKSNYSSAGEEMVLRWEDGVFKHYENPQKGKINKCDIQRQGIEDKIINLIMSEALKGKVYTCNQFAECFDGREDLGAKDTIRSKLSVYATQQKIQFFINGTDYGLKKPSRSKFGYMWVEGMKIPYQGGYKAVIPTHHKCPNTGEQVLIKRP